jgi:CheY-like chemotaxis protein
VIPRIRSVTSFFWIPLKTTGVTTLQTRSDAGDAAWHASTPFLRRVSCGSGHNELPVGVLRHVAHTLARIIGLEIGADDCLAKPFDLQELLARLRSVLRRTRDRARV